MPDASLMTPVSTAPFHSVTRTSSTRADSPTVTGVPASPAYAAPNADVRYALRSAVTTNRPAGSASNAKRPAPSVIVLRLTPSAGDVIVTIARRTGCGERSAVTTMPARTEEPDGATRAPSRGCCGAAARTVSTSETRITVIARGLSEGSAFSLPPSRSRRERRGPGPARGTWDPATLRSPPPRRRRGSTPPQAAS